MGDLSSAIKSLNSRIELRKGGSSEDWFFLAMAEWQLGNKGAVRARTTRQWNGWRKTTRRRRN